MPSFQMIILTAWHAYPPVSKLSRPPPSLISPTFISIHLHVLLLTIRISLKPTRILFKFDALIITMIIHLIAGYMFFAVSALLIVFIVVLWILVAIVWVVVSVARLAERFMTESAGIGLF